MQHAADTDRKAKEAEAVKKAKLANGSITGAGSSGVQDKPKTLDEVVDHAFAGF